MKYEIQVPDRLVEWFRQRVDEELDPAAVLADFVESVVNQKVANKENRIQLHYLCKKIQQGGLTL